MLYRTGFSKFFVVGAMLIAGICAPAKAANEQSLIVELNNSESRDNTCLLTFVVNNKLDQNLAELAYEVVVFDQDMKVDRLTIFDFKKIASGKMRVRQFRLPGADCSKLGRLLINNSSKCASTEKLPEMCMNKLELLNKTKIEFIN